MAAPIFFVDIFVEIGRAFNHIEDNSLRGAGDVMFSMVVSIFSSWAMSILFSYILGVGIGNIPSVLAQLPEWVNMIFAQNSIIMTFVVATVLNLILPKKKAPEPAAKQDQA